MENKRTNILIALAFLIVLSSFCYAFASITLFDSDFWWHISTGRYIVENRVIPDKDPFSYTEILEENKNLLPERENFLLKQYWLSQVIFFLIFDNSGAKGIIILRAIILTMVIFMILWQLKRWNTSFYIAFILIFFVYLDALRYTGERPVLFSILLTPLVFIILEHFREKKGKTIFLLLPVMLLWSNLHGGFIIGNILIVVYMTIEGIKIVLKKTSYTGPDIVIFFAATGLALALSYMNPTGWQAFSIALSPKYKFLEVGIQEYQPPFMLYLHKLSPINYGHAVLMTLFPIVLIIRNKKMDLTSLVLLSGLFVMALKTGRYSIYYSSIAAMIFGREIDPLFRSLLAKLSDTLRPRVLSAFIVVTILSSIFFSFGIFKYHFLTLDIARGSFVPIDAVNFISENKLPGNMLNSHPFGGYLAWRLYPWKKTFIDTRWLNYTLQSEYAWITGAVETLSEKELPKEQTPLWKRLLNHYKINFIVIQTLDVYGTVPKLLLKLSDDEEWVPVYCEPIAVIFIKNIPENNYIIEKFRRSKDDVYNTIISIASYLAIYQEKNPKYLKTIGKTFYTMGRLEDALTAYQYALNRFPKEDGVKEMIDRIKSELKNKDEKH